MNIKINDGEHIIVTGITGSGKTTFVKKYLRSVERFVVFDLKDGGEWDTIGNNVLRLETFLGGSWDIHKKKMVLRCVTYQRNFKRDFETALLYLSCEYFNKFVVVVDDAYVVANSERLELYFATQRCHLTLILISQYFKSFKSLIKANACHIFFFKQNIWAMEKLSFLTVDDVKIINGLDKYDFYYINSYTNRRCLLKH